MKIYARRRFLFGGFMVAALTILAGAASAQMAAIAAVDEPVPAEAGGSVGGTGAKHALQKAGKGASQVKKTGATAKNSKTSATLRPKSSPAPPVPYNGPVLGDKYTFLNFEVASAEKPYYTRAAKASGAKGLVQVEVLVSTDGSVLTAKARTGNKELWPEAERAALASKFKRPSADGRAARAMGFLVYRFGPGDDE